MLANHEFMVSLSTTARNLAFLCAIQKVHFGTEFQIGSNKLNSKPYQLDKTDRRILNALQRDGRVQNLELAKRVGLSPSTCLRRVRLLEEAGVVRGYAALLDGAKVGIGVSVFTRVWLTGQDEETVHQFTELVKQMPQVLECHLMAGDCDFLLRVAVEDLSAYRRFQMQHLTNLKIVQSVKTEIPMEEIKCTSKIEL